MIVAAMHVTCKHKPYTTKAFQHNAAAAVKQCMQQGNIFVKLVCAHENTLFTVHVM